MIVLGRSIITQFSLLHPPTDERGSLGWTKNKCINKCAANIIGFWLLSKRQQLEIKNNICFVNFVQSVNNGANLAEKLCKVSVPPGQSIDYLPLTFQHPTKSAMGIQIFPMVNQWWLAAHTLRVSFLQQQSMERTKWAHLVVMLSVLKCWWHGKIFIDYAYVCAYFRVRYKFLFHKEKY